MIIINTVAKETKRGVRVWMEGGKLTQAGWNCGDRFNIEFDTGNNYNPDQESTRVHSGVATDHLDPLSIYTQNALRSFLKRVQLLNAR